MREDEKKTEEGRRACEGTLRLSVALRLFLFFFFYFFFFPFLRFHGASCLLEEGGV